MLSVYRNARIEHRGGRGGGNLQTEYMPGSLSDVWERILSNICLFVSLFFLQILNCICVVMLVCANVCLCSNARWCCI